MITRRPWGQHICLRCQRSLAKRALHPQSPVLQRFSERRRYSQQAARKVNDDQNSESSDVDVGRIREEKYETKAARPLGKLRGHRGLYKREDLEELRGATALGDKAKVIVLRDSIFSKYALDEQKMRKVKPKHIDILGQLAEERGLVGEEEVTENINGFRPEEEGGPRDFDQIKELVLKLQESFTAPQLDKYIKDFKGKCKQEDPDNVWNAKNSTAPITRITPWQPGISEIEEYFENDPLRGYGLESYNPKQRLVLRLLRECWMIELPELADGIGQFEIQVQNADLDLLLWGRNSALDKIQSTHLLFQEEKLEAFRSRNTIRVTTIHAKKYAIVEAIQQSILGIRRGKIDILALLPRPVNHSRRLEKFMELHFDSSVLARLGDITSTKIARKHLGHLHVSWIEDKPNTRSSRIDDVRRLILTCDNFSSRLEHELALKQKQSTTAALVDCALTVGLPWRQRMRSWTRFAAPISKEAPNAADPITEEESIIEPKLSSLPRTQSSTTEPPQVTQSGEDAEAQDKQLHWSKRYFTETSAMIGTVLHSPNPHSPPLTPTSTPLNTFGLLHAFSTKVPNISRTLSKADACQDLTSTNRLIIRLQPDPFFPVPKQKARQTYPSQKKEIPIGVEALSAFPSLEICLDIDGDTKETKLRAVNAIVQEKRTDVMLPENAVDVRFQQKIISRLTKFSKPIRSFIAKSQLSFAGRGRLSTPPSITLPISSHLCRDEGFKLLRPEAKNPKSNPDEREVQYHFAGLEIHRTLTFEWMNFRLHYTSIQTGKAGGKRSELKLRPIKNGEVATEAEFVAAAYQLADELGDGSGGRSGLGNVKTLATSYQRSGFSKSTPSEPQLLFSYFSGKFKINNLVGGESVAWEKTENIESEAENDGANDEDRDDVSNKVMEELDND
ncbi:hypothetical protein EG329_008965 [Mollisiaceae sp. DMI_Dod_QoI]|nr:hypothetical protein EG329_008965 [Helotiales sp. DMI_Dod_QoI]